MACSFLTNLNRVKHKTLTLFISHKNTISVLADITDHPWPVHHGFHYIISRPSCIFYIFYIIEEPGNQLDISHPDPTLLCNQNAYIFYMFYMFYIFYIPDSCYVITVVTNNLHCIYNDFHYIISMLSYNIFYIFYMFY